MDDSEALEVLVIEDNEVQIEKAKRELPIFLKPEIARIDFASNYQQYQIKLDSKKYNGIITDIFFPFSKEQPYNSRIIASCNSLLDTPEFHEHLEDYAGHYKKKILELMNRWKCKKALVPLGALVVNDALFTNTPIVCISENIESNPILDPFLFYIYKRDIPFFDFKPGHDLDCKKWAWAGRTLLNRIKDQEEINKKFWGKN